MSEENNIIALSGGDNYYYTNLSHNEYYGVHFNCAFEFNEFHVECGCHSVEGGTVKVGIYAWLGSAERSLSSTVLVQEKFDLKKGNVLALKFKKLLPGEYFVALTDATLGAGFCGNFIDFPNTQLYLNGYAVPGSMKASVILCKDPQGDSLLPISAGADRTTDDSIYDNISSSVNYDNWIMTDGLDRDISNNFGEKNNKQVGIFYWDWHYNFAFNKPVNLNELIKNFPDAANDYSHPTWQINNATYYFWNKPLFGYYDNRDQYIVEKHAELLAEAGIDFIVFDCSNGSYTWHDGYVALFEGFERALKRGVKVPKVAFMLGFLPIIDTKAAYYKVYTDIYKPGKYNNLWYIHEGKPLILGRSEILDENIPFDKEIIEFFTHKNNDPNYFSLGTDTPNKWWGWLSTTPQSTYGRRDDGSCEMTTVSVAQNANDTELCAMNDSRGNIHGRSFSHNKKYLAAFPSRGGTEYVGSSDNRAIKFGVNYQEQWDYALSLNPDIIFITGWNEWIASHVPSWQGTSGAFPDEFNDEYSRDIEPSAGDLRDYYYTQTVYNIRRFKGCVPEENKVYDIGFSDVPVTPDSSFWKDVKPEYFYKDAAPERRSTGWKGEYYMAPPASNVITATLSARDDNNLYILAECKDKIYNNDLSLLLSEKRRETGFEGFNFLVGRIVSSDGSSSVEKLDTDENEKAVLSRAEKAFVKIKSNKILFTIPLAIFSLDEISYKICGGLNPIKDITSIYKYGYSAPGGRFAVKINLKNND